MSKLETRVTYTPINPDGSKGDPVQLMMIGADGKPIAWTLDEPHAYESDTVAAVELAKEYGVAVPRSTASAAMVIDDQAGERRVWNVDLGALSPAAVKRLHANLLPDGMERICEVPLAAPKQAEVTDATVTANTAAAVAAVPVAAPPARTQAMVDAEKDKIREDERKKLKKEAREQAVRDHAAKIRVVATGHAAEAEEADNPAAADEAVEKAAQYRVDDAGHQDECDILQQARQWKAAGRPSPVARKTADGWRNVGEVAWHEDHKLLVLDRLDREYRAAQRALEAAYAKAGALEEELAALKAEHREDAAEVNVLARPGARAALRDGERGQEYARERLAQLEEAAEVDSGFDSSLTGGSAASAYHDDFNPDELMKDPVFAAVARDFADERWQAQRADAYSRYLAAHAGNVAGARAAADAVLDPLAPDADGSVFAAGMANLDDRRAIFQEAWSRMQNVAFDADAAREDPRFREVCRRLMPQIVEEERRRYAQQLADKADPPRVPPGAVMPGDIDQAMRAIPADVFAEPSAYRTETYGYGASTSVARVPVDVSGTPHYAAHARLMRRAWAEVSSVDAAGLPTGYAKLRAEVAAEMAGERVAAVAEATEMEVMRIMRFDPTGRKVVTPEMMAAKAQEIADLALAARKAGQNGAAIPITYKDFDGQDRTVNLDTTDAGPLIAAGGAALDADAAAHASIVDDITAARDVPATIDPAVLDRARERDVARWQAALAAAPAGDVDLSYRAADGSMANLTIPAAHRAAICLDGNGDPDPAKLRRLWNHDDASFPAGGTRAAVAALPDVQVASMDHYQALELRHRQALSTTSPDVAYMQRVMAAGGGPYRFDIPAPPAARVCQTAAIPRADLVGADGNVSEAKLREAWLRVVLPATPAEIALAQARAEQRFEAAIDRVAQQRFRLVAGTAAGRTRAAAFARTMRESGRRKAAVDSLVVVVDAQLAKAEAGGPASLVGGLCTAVKADAARFAQLNQTVPPAPGTRVVPDEQLAQLVEVVLLDHPDLADWEKTPPVLKAGSEAVFLQCMKDEVEDKFQAELAAEKVKYFSEMQRDNPEVNLEGGPPQKWQSMSVHQQQQYWLQKGRGPVVEALCEAKLDKAKHAAAERELDQDLSNVEELRAQVAEKRAALLEAQRRMADAPKEEFNAWLQRQRELELVQKQIAGMYFDDDGVLRDADGKDVVDEMFEGGGKLKERVQMLADQHRMVKDTLDNLFDANDGFSFLMLLFVNMVTCCVTKAKTGEFMKLGTLMSKEGQMQWELGGDKAREKALAQAEELVVNSIKDEGGKRTVDLSHLKGKVSRPMLVACAAQALRGFKPDQIKGLDADVMADAQKHIMKPLREMRDQRAAEAGAKTRGKVTAARTDVRRRSGRGRGSGADARASTRAAPKTGERATEQQRGVRQGEGSGGRSAGARVRSRNVAAAKARAARSAARRTGTTAPPVSTGRGRGSAG